MVLEDECQQFYQRPSAVGSSITYCHHRLEIFTSAEGKLLGSEDKVRGEVSCMDGRRMVFISFIFLF